MGGERARLRGLSLFSGIGGLERGLTLALGDEYETLGYVEIDGYCQWVLAARIAAGDLAGGFIHGDITRFDGRPWRGRVDLISGGFPCQDISQAGKREGIHAERSGLWREYARLIGEIGPRYVFVENVAAIVGRGLNVVLADLACLGYDAEWLTLRASDVGAPHRRARVFILAHAQRDGRGERGDAPSGGNAPQTPGTRAGRDGVADATIPRLEVGRGERGGVGAEPLFATVERDCGALADATIRRERGQSRPDDSAWASIERGGSAVPHADDERRHDARSAPCDERADGADTRDGQLSEQGGQSEGRDGPRPAGANDGVADARGRGGERPALRQDTERGSTEWADATSGRTQPVQQPRQLCGIEPEGSVLPWWPPGPADRDGWQRVIARWPDLAPATEKTTEPFVCRMVDGLPVWLDPAGVYRTGRLRALGNAVVPAAAAAAFAILWDRLPEGRAGEERVTDEASDGD